MQNDTHLIFQQESQYSVAEKTNHEILQQLFSQTFKVAIAHAIASLIIIFWWAKVANIDELMVWFAVVTFLSCFRLVLQTAYKKSGDQKNRHLWFHAWALCSGLMGSVYGLAFVYFTPFEQAEYAVSVGLFIVVLSAGAVMVHSASKYGVVSFLAPIILIPSYFLFNVGGNAGQLTLATIGLYAIAVFIMLNTMSTSQKKAILLGFQHQQERKKRKLIEKQLQDTNRRDGLTGLFNRRYFDETLEAEIGRAHRNHQPLCVLMIDIDCFKEYNIEYGHIAGDTCLVTVAEIVQALSNRKGDLMARYGGEEFAIILPNIDANGAVAFASKLQQEIQNKRIPHTASKLKTMDYVTISVGVTNLMPFTKVSPAELIKNADKALYEAKRQGRNQVYFNGNSGLNHGAPL